MFSFLTNLPGRGCGWLLQSRSSSPPSDVDFCPLASLCCRASVDEYGWIAAAVGWSLWFLTLILLCVDKLMKLTPEEPKDLAA